MSNLTVEELGFIALPAEAHEQACGGCGDFYSAPHDTISADEGDGGAMVDLVCGNCGCQSFFSWPLSDEEYEAVFGHAFDECPADGEIES